MNSPPISGGKRDALSDVEIAAPPGELLVFSRNMRNPHRPLLNAPDYYRWDMVSFLPLTFGSCYSSGLTVYWSDFQVIGMASHGPRGQSASIGQRSKYAMHFALGPEEFFTSFWLRPSSSFRGLIESPFLITVRIL